MRVAGIVFALIAAAMGAWFLFGSSPGDAPPGLTFPDSPTATTTAHTIPPGMREYRNDAYRFAIVHPENLRLTEAAEGGGASTITFEDSDEGVGFQLYVLPYQDDQVSAERFRMDVPSGVREHERTVTIDDASGSAFYSTHAGLGETFEVWLVHNGFLYEITTLAPLDAWLADILQRWRFI